MPSKVKIIDTETLKSMHTGSLMSRRKALLACEESVESSDRETGYLIEKGLIEFKQSPEWKKAYKELKSELSTRKNWRT